MSMIYSLTTVVVVVVIVVVIGVDVGVCVGGDGDVDRGGKGLSVRPPTKSGRFDPDVVFRIPFCFCPAIDPGFQRAGAIPRTGRRCAAVITT